MFFSASSTASPFSSSVIWAFSFGFTAQVVIRKFLIESAFATKIGVNPEMVSWTIISTAGVVSSSSVSDPVLRQSLSSETSSSPSSSSYAAAARACFTPRLIPLSVEIRSPVTLICVYPSPSPLKSTLIPFFAIRSPPMFSWAVPLFSQFGPWFVRVTPVPSTASTSPPMSILISPL